MTHSCDLINSTNTVSITVPLSLVAALSVDTNNVRLLGHRGNATLQNKWAHRKGRALSGRHCWTQKEVSAYSYNFLVKKMRGEKKNKIFRRPTEVRLSKQPPSLSRTRPRTAAPWPAGTRHTTLSLLRSETGGGGKGTGTRLTGRRDCSRASKAPAPLKLQFCKRPASANTCILYGFLKGFC